MIYLAPRLGNQRREASGVYGSAAWLKKGRQHTSIYISINGFVRVSISKKSRWPAPVTFVCLAEQLESGRGGPVVFNLNVHGWSAPLNCRLGSAQHIFLHTLHVCGFRCQWWSSIGMRMGGCPCSLEGGHTVSRPCPPNHDAEETSLKYGKISTHILAGKTNRS